MHNPEQVYYKVFNENPERVREQIRGFSVTRNEHQKLQSFVWSVFQKYQQHGIVDVMPLDSIFCVRACCLMGNENRTFYFDEDRLSTAGVGLALEAVASSLRFHQPASSHAQTASHVHVSSKL